MSARKAALATTIDAKTLDYIEEVERVRDLEADHREKKHASEHLILKNAVDELRMRVTELEGADTPAVDTEKYALTKAKLVRLMKDMGFYD